MADKTYAHNQGAQLGAQVPTSQWPAARTPGGQGPGGAGSAPMGQGTGAASLTRMPGARRRRQPELDPVNQGELVMVVDL